LKEEAPPGFEPGMADLQSAAPTAEAHCVPILTADDSSRLHTGCTDHHELPVDLVRLVTAWPKLPEHIRGAILTLADGYQ
jgi:hypothetical protein